MIESSEEIQQSKTQRTIQRLLNLSKAQHKRLKEQEKSLQEARAELKEVRVELEEVKTSNKAQSILIERLVTKEAGQVAINTRNLQRLRIVGMLVFCALGVGSTIDYKPLEGTSTSAPFSIHGDRLSSLLTAMTGAGGAAALFFLKKNDEPKPD